MKLSVERIAIIAAEFGKEIVDEMIDTAIKELENLGGRSIRTARVAGCYEVPLIAEMMCAQDEVDAIVVLGYIERGETLHGEVMGHVIHRALVDIQLKYQKPMGIGIIGPGATRAQALTRKSGCAAGAVRAVVQSIGILNDLHGTDW